jgi:hypothetical protein
VISRRCAPGRRTAPVSRSRRPIEPERPPAPGGRERTTAASSLAAISRSYRGTRVAAHRGMPISSTNPSTDPSFRPGADPVPSAPDRESVTLPGAGNTQVVPPGTDIEAQPGADGKPRPVVIKPDLPDEDEDAINDEKDRKAAGATPPIR